MLKLFVLGILVWVGGVMSQTPAPCVVPAQFSARASQYDEETFHVNRYYMAYDALNRRRVLFEEQNVTMPGRQYLEFLELGNENVMYEINLSLKTCTKSVPRRPFRPYGIPPNATFENEFYIGGPGEEVFAQEWSDRIPYSRREYWVGVFSLNNCYPIREILIADYDTRNFTAITNFYDVVQGINNPNDFVPPAECSQAKWGKVRMPF